MSRTSWSVYTHFTDEQAEAGGGEGFIEGHPSELPAQLALRPKSCESQAVSICDTSPTRKQRLLPTAIKYPLFQAVI